MKKALREVKKSKTPRMKAIKIFLVVFFCSQALGVSYADEEYPICNEFDPSQESFGEHKWREYQTGQDYIHNLQRTFYEVRDERTLV